MQAIENVKRLGKIKCFFYKNEYSLEFDCYKIKINKIATLNSKTDAKYRYLKLNMPLKWIKIIYTFFANKYN